MAAALTATLRTAIAAGLACLLGAALGGCSRFVILNDPLTAAEHNDLGVAYESSGRSDLARREYRRALRDDGGFARARVNIGNLEAAAARWSRAEALYRRALRDAPSDPDARNNLAVTLLQRRRGLDEAEWMARSALALALPHDSIPRATLAEVLARRRSRRP
jgi:Flp pilus assembly protein TadD